MQGGTLATFQGWPLRDVTFSRSRGYTPSSAVMVFAVADFPDGFDFAAPKPGDLGRPAPPPDVAPGDIGVARGPAPLARRLNYEGWLVMAESVNGQTWAFPPVRLFVMSSEVVKQSDGSPVGFVRVVAVDERFFWDHGWLSRHSYNRPRADGTVALDSVSEDGQALSRRDIARDVLSCLFRRPALAAAPAEWTNDRSSFQAFPNCAPVVALAQLVNASDLVDPCLLLDGTVGLFRAGEGKVGYAPGGRGPNVEEFPREVRLSKDGTGQAAAVEWLYPSDYVLVAGGLKVVTVAIDDCVPVLDVNGATIEVTEENVRYLTQGRFGLEWLQRFVFLPADFAGAPDLPEPIARLFREQAYRLWQVRGAEVDVPDEPPEGASEAERGRHFVRVPGPNAHLLPVIDRAETIAGRRMPPALETYTFAIRRKFLAGGGAQAKQITAMAQLSRLRAEIIAASHAQSRRNPFGSTVRFGGTRDAAQLDPRQFLERGDVADFLEAGGNLDTLLSYVNQARMVERIAEQAGSGLAGQYEAALRERFAAEDEAGELSSRMYEVAKKFLELEKQAKATGGGLGDFFAERLELDAAAKQSVADRFKSGGFAEAFAQEVQALTRELRLRKEEKQRRAQVGGREGVDIPSMTFFVNVARTIDSGARVYDAQRGIFESAGLAGHLVEPKIHDLTHSQAQLSVCPVRAVFGATLRPRLDVPYRTKPRPQTGGEPGVSDSQADCPGGDNVIPEALEDAECYYLAAFRRGPSGGAVPIPVSEVPRDQVLVVQRPDLVELVELSGATNRGALDLEAARVASEMFKTRPLLKAASTVLARPWPVQCDGLVERVTVRMRQKDGAPCGFETEVVTGTDEAPSGGGTRTDPARRGAAALRAQQEAARREGVRT
ncbi:MAG: hypothetical protein M9894_39660 [Planctomycetes bacterium]|nr:hypothetical protein [Planctomycetota bacterium]